MNFEQQNTQAKTKRRSRLRFSLRNFLIVFSVIGVIVGPLCYRANRQKSAVESITKFGGTIYYSYQVIDPNEIRARPTGASESENYAKSYRPQAQPIWPAWIRNLLGNEYFVTPIALVIKTEKPIKHETFSHFRSLPHLEELSFYDVKITSKHVQHIKHLRKLRVLNFQTITQDTDQPIDFKYLKNLTELRVFSLRDSRLLDHGAEQVFGLSKLKLVFLYDCGISDHGLASLKNLEAPDMLGLSYNKITDKGLSHISHLQSLKYLALGGTEITDSGIDELLKLKNLESLEIYKTKITDAGYQRIREGLPNCEVQ